MKSFSNFIKKYSLEATLTCIALFISFWLMFHTFSYSNGTMLIGSKAWSDFSANIPLIRSFSFGNNFPPEYPLFPGSPIRYHFLFYLFVGLLEKIGFRIDFALNILSSLGFYFLLFAIYLLAKILFQSKGTALLSALFFLFNGTLSFIYFFGNHSISPHTLADIITNQKFPSFGPYDSGIVSAFWNLNIYTNQRHLAPAYAASIGLIIILLYYALQQKKPPLLLSLSLGLLFGVSFFFHIAVFVMTAVVLCGLFLFFRQLRLSSFLILLISGTLLVPQYLYYKTGGSSSPLLFVPGYLIHDNLNFLNFIRYWFANLGLHFLFIPLGFILAPRSAKKIFLCILPMFFVGNLFQFSPEMASNHKFFNYFMIFGSMFSAYFLVWIWKKSIITRPLVCIFSFLLILSGIIDFFPIYNDSLLTLNDYPQNSHIRWIIKHTDPKGVFFNASYIFDDASLAGRKIVMGWPYFAWSAGYDTNSRGRLMGQIMTTTTLADACRLLQTNHINYLEINKRDPLDSTITLPAFVYQSQMTPIYQDTNALYALYDIKQTCQQQ